MRGVRVKETIEILLVDHVAEMLRLTDSALSGEEDMRVVGLFSSGEEALRRLAETEPDVVLVAEGLEDMESANLVWQITSEHPYLPVIALGPSSDRGLMRRFMVVGARGFVSQPVDFKELRNTIRAVYQRAAREKAARLRVPQAVTGPLDGGLGGPGTVVAVFGAKGGVGKTVVAVNLAVALQTITGERVGLVDADFAFGDAAVHLDLNPTHSFLNFVEHVEQERGDIDPQYLRGIMVRHRSGLRVLCRPPRPEHAELIKAEHVQAVLNLLPSLFRFVVVDCWPSYDDRMLAVLDTADVIFLLLTPELGAIANSVAFLELAEALGYETDRLHLVLNRTGSGTGIDNADVEKALGRKVEFTLPTAGRALTLSINRGRPLCLQEPRSPYCQQMMKIVRAVARQAGCEVPSAGSGLRATVTG